MIATAPRGGLSLRTPIAISSALHVVVASSLLLSRRAASVPVPPTYRVSLVAAPPGPRQVGVVEPAPPKPAPSTPTPPPAPASRELPDPSRMRAPAKVAKARTPKVATPAVGATPVKAAAPAPAAGGGPTGGRGADVANVQVAGIEFPYPAYLQNVVRRIAMQFTPSRGGSLTAVVAFLIRRDGSVSGIRLTTRSGVYSFDTEAMGAVEAAAPSFGPLPTGFRDDVLPVIFSFDPRLIR